MMVIWIVVFRAFLLSFGLAHPLKEMVEQVDGSHANTQQILDQVKDTELPILLKRLKGLDIPDLAGLTKTPLGQVEYNLKNIKLSDVSIPKSNLSVTMLNGVHLTAQDGSMDVGAKWHYREKSWPHISDSGTCNVSLRGMSLSLGLKLGAIFAEESSEQSQMNCNLSINKVKVKFFGKVSWLYNLFSGLLARRIKPDLEKQICSTAVASMKGKGLAALMGLPGVMKSDKKQWKNRIDHIK